MQNTEVKFKDIGISIADFYDLSIIDKGNILVGFEDFYIKNKFVIDKFGETWNWFTELTGSDRRGMFMGQFKQCVFSVVLYMRSKQAGRDISNECGSIAAIRYRNNTIPDLVVFKLIAS